MINLEKQKKTWFKFIFPLYPINFFKSTTLICILAMLISLRMIMQFFTIPIPQFGMVFSIAHTPLIIIGWLFGPIIGFSAGIVTDTISFFIKPGSIWFWLYAIQEPLLGLISGIIGSLYLINKNNDSITKELIINKLIMYMFSFFTLIVILLYASPTNNFQGVLELQANGFFSIYKYISIIVIIFFLIAYEFSFILLSKNKKEYKRLFLYISTIVFLNAILFSFFLGTISVVEYNKLFFPGNSNFIKYGSMFYVIPRVIKESIKTPLQLYILFAIIYSIIPNFENTLNNIKLSWNTKII